MLPHYLEEFKSSNLSQIWKKMQKQKMPQLSEEKSHEQSLNLPSLLFCRLMKGVQTVKKHKK